MKSNLSNSSLVKYNMRIIIGTSRFGKTKELSPFISNLLKSKIYKNHTVKILKYGSESPNVSTLNKVILLPWRLFLFCLKTWLFAPDIIHLNTAINKKALMRDILYIAFLKFQKRKICIEFHGCDLNWAKSTSALCKRLFSFGLDKVDAKLFLNQTDKIYFRNEWGFNNTYLCKVPIDYNKDITGKPLDGNIVLFVGRLVESKGIRDLVQAVHYLAKRDVSVKVRVAGDGILLRELQTLVKKLGISNDFTWLGFISGERVLCEYQNANIFVLPTNHQEGLPIVILFALNYGLPIITTTNKGNIDYLKEPQNCLFIKPKSPESLAQTIAYITENFKLREQMFENNRELAKQFDKEIVASEFEAIYLKVLQ